MILIQQDNFFDDIQAIRSLAFGVTLYDCDRYNTEFNRAEDWPGQRTNLLSEAEPELNNIIHQHLHRNPMFQGLQFNTFVHFRGEGCEDWVHMDREPLAGIIYINPTHYEAGTRIYDQNQQWITDCRYVQNRIVMYSGGYLHQGYGHHGHHATQGRTTINLFLAGE